MLTLEPHALRVGLCSTRSDKGARSRTHGHTTASCPTRGPLLYQIRQRSPLARTHAHDIFYRALCPKRMPPLLTPFSYIKLHLTKMNLLMRVNRVRYTAWSVILQLCVLDTVVDFPSMAGNNKKCRKVTTRARLLTRNVL